VPRRAVRVFWLHELPRPAPDSDRGRVYAEHHDVADRRRPASASGSSTPYEYETIASFGDRSAHHRGHARNRQDGRRRPVRRGPYTLACAAALPDRVVAAGVLGGVAPTCGPDRGSAAV